MLRLIGERHGRYRPPHDIEDGTACRAGAELGTYTITVEAKDESGNTAMDTVEVKVPKSRSKKGR